MIGKQEGFNSHALGVDDQEHLKEYFGDIVTTMFTLFRIITMDSWHTIAMPVIKYLPMWRLFFVGFIVFGSWTMISLLTAVVSDHMMAATADFQELEARRAHETKMAFVAYL